MATLVYKSPNGNYFIYKNTDALWQEVFGKDAGWYSILKAWDAVDAIPVQQELSLKDAFKWLWNMRIISKDEFLFQVREKCREQK